MKALTIDQAQHHWIPLDAEPEQLGDVIRAFAQSAACDFAELNRIVDTASQVPTFTEGPTRFLLVAEDRSWYVLEVNLLSDDPNAPFDPSTDLAGGHPEEVFIGESLSGHRLILLEPAGPAGQLDGANSEMLLARVNYFLRHSARPGDWLYAGVYVPDPVDLGVIVPMVESLLGTVGP